MNITTEQPNPQEVEKFKEKHFHEVKPQGSRHQRRERNRIDDILKALTMEFIRFKHKNAAIVMDFSAGEKSVLQKQKEDMIAKKYVECNTKWQNVCHKKWRYNKPISTAFEKSIQANIVPIKTQSKIFNK